MVFPRTWVYRVAKLTSRRDDNVAPALGKIVTCRANNADRRVGEPVCDC